MVASADLRATGVEGQRICPSHIKVVTSVVVAGGGGLKSAAASSVSAAVASSSSGNKYDSATVLSKSLSYSTSNSRQDSETGRGGVNYEEQKSSDVSRREGAALAEEEQRDQCDLIDHDDFDQRGAAAPTTTKNSSDSLSEPRQDGASHEELIYHYAATKPKSKAEFTTTVTARTARTATAATTVVRPSPFAVNNAQVQLIGLPSSVGSASSTDLDEEHSHSTSSSFSGDDIDEDDGASYSREGSSWSGSRTHGTSIQTRGSQTHEGSQDSRTQDSRTYSEGSQTNDIFSREEEEEDNVDDEEDDLEDFLDENLEDDLLDDLDDEEYDEEDDKEPDIRDLYAEGISELYAEGATRAFGLVVNGLEDDLLDDLDDEEYDEEDDKEPDIRDLYAEGISELYAEGATRAFGLVVKGLGGNIDASQDEEDQKTRVRMKQRRAGRKNSHATGTYADDEHSEGSLSYFDVPTTDDLSLTVRTDREKVNRDDHHYGRYDSIHAENDIARADIDTDDGNKSHQQEQEKDQEERQDTATTTDKKIDGAVETQDNNDDCHQGDDGSFTLSNVESRDSRSVASRSAGNSTTATSPKSMNLLIHGILPSGRPLVYNRAADEQVILRGVLPSGRRIELDERDANIMSQTLSFETYSPRSSVKSSISPHIPRRPVGVGCGSPCGSPPRSPAIRTAVSVSALDEDKKRTDNGGRRFSFNEAVNKQGTVVEDSANKKITPASKETTTSTNKSGGKPGHYDETPLINNTKREVEYLSSKHKDKADDGSDEVPNVLQMTFPMELADEDLMEVERKERQAAAEKKRRKKIMADELNIEGSDIEAVMTDVSLCRTENDKDDNDNDNNVDTMASYLKRMVVFDVAQRACDIDTPQASAAASRNDVHKDALGSSTTTKTINSPEKAEAMLDDMLVEPKKQLFNLLKIISGGTTLEEGEEHNDTAASSIDKEEKKDHDDNDEDWYHTSRRAVDLSIKRVDTTTAAATDRYEKLKEASVRRENACGALRFMASTKSAQSILGRTRGVIPALSAALVDGDASLEQKIRCMNTLILLSQNAKVRSIMLKFQALPTALKKAAIDESPQVRNLVCVFLVSLTQDKANRAAVGQIFLDPAVHILDLASAFDDVQPRRDTTKYGRRSFRAAGDKALPNVLSDMTMDDALSTLETVVAGNISPKCPSQKPSGPPLHDVYFQARSHALKVLLDLSNVPRLATILARHVDLLATLIRLAGGLKAADNMLITAIVTNLTRHPGNATLLAGNDSFISALIEEVVNSSDEERRKCALYALRNLTVESETQKILISNDDLFKSLAGHYAKSEVVDTRIAILCVLQNLSNDVSFLLMIPSMPNMVNDLVNKTNAGESTVEKHLACDILESLSKWMWSASYTGNLAKEIQLGGNGCTGFGFRTPAKPFMTAKVHDQWE